MEGKPFRKLFNDCFKDSHILKDLLLNIWKKNWPSQMSFYGWVCPDFCNTKMQSCDNLFIAFSCQSEYFMQFCCRFSQNYFKIFPVESSGGTAPRFIEVVSHIIVSSNKLWQPTLMTFSMTAFKEQRFSIRNFTTN